MNNFYSKTHFQILKNEWAPILAPCAYPASKLFNPFFREVNFFQLENFLGSYLVMFPNFEQ